MSILLDILLKERILTKSSIKAVTHYAESWKVSIYDAILDCNIATETQLADVISKDLRLDRLYHLNVAMVSEDARNRLDFETARNMCAIPVRLIGKDLDTVEIAVANPLEENLLQTLEEKTGCKVLAVVAEKKSILSVIYDAYPIEMQITSLGEGNLR